MIASDLFEHNLSHEDSNTALSPKYMKHQLVGVQEIFSKDDQEQQNHSLFQKIISLTGLDLSSKRRGEVVWIEGTLTVSF